MGRRPRILVAGGIYHVYNRVSRGEHVFRNDKEADRLEDLFATIKERDEFQILAWLGLELYGFTVKEIVEGFEKCRETASRLVGRAAQRRSVDQGFADRVHRVDSLIADGKG